MTENTQQLPRPWSFNFGLPLYAIGIFLLLSKAETGIMFMTIATFIGLLDHYRNSHAPYASWAERIGVYCYVLALISSLFKGCRYEQVALFVAGLTFAGTQPLKEVGPFLRRTLVSINPDRWVDIFGNLVGFIGFLILTATLIGGLGIWISRDSISIGVSSNLLKGLPAILAAMFLGIFFLALGVGIRRRAVWAGALGLCFTFYWFMRELNQVFLDTGGNLANLPETLVQHAFGLFFHWCFFFGFYSIFFPSVSSHAQKLAGALEIKLKAADELLEDAKHKLNHAEHQVAQTARSLEEERLKFQAAFETINEGIVIFDANNLILYANPAYCSLYEIKREEWLGKSWVPVFERPGIECIHSGLMSPEQLGRFHDSGIERPAGGEIILRDEKGNIRRRTAFYSKKITDANGEFLAFIGFSRDVTLEREIDRMKTEFVSNVSHELRTPLTSIRAYTEMLIDGEAQNPETSHDYLKIILDEAERLTNLINDILDLSKMEAGKKTYKFTSFSPFQLLKKVFTICESGAEKKRQHLELALPQEERQGFGDVDLLHQAILNLVNNAVKYTPEDGTITITLTYGTDWYQISVADTGPGISPEDQKSLFTKFFRVENSLNREIGGTGLGLALVKNILQVHQGDIEVRSELGKGSAFSMRLPFSFTPRT